MKNQPDNVEPVPPSQETGDNAGTRGVPAFLRRLGSITGIAVAASLALALAFGSFNARGISNAFVIAAFALLFLAVLPVFSEVGSSVLMIGKAAAEHKSLRALLDGEREKRDRGARQTYLYGLAGILLFLLSLIAVSFYQ